MVLVIFENINSGTIFKTLINPICLCGQDVETTSHFLLNCPQYVTIRKTFLDKVKMISGHFIEKRHIICLTYKMLSNILLFGDALLSTENNTFILKSTIEFLLESKRFDEPLF